MSSYTKDSELFAFIIYLETGNSYVCVDHFIHYWYILQRNIKDTRCSYIPPVFYFIQKNHIINYGRNKTRYYGSLECLLETEFAELL